MKIGLQTWGSDGDIRPFLALAGGLQERGHEVTLVVTSVDNKDYGAFGRKMGYALRHAGRLSYDEAEQRRLTKKLIDSPHFVLEVDLIMTYFFNPVIPEMFDAAQQLCRENDVIVGHFAHYPAHAAAEEAGKPYLTVALNHGGIYSKHSRVHGSPDIKWLYPASWKLANFLADITMGRDINKFRKRAGLPPVKNIMHTVMTSHLLNLIAVSAAIGARRPDWPEYQQVCGFFSVPDHSEDWIMPADLRGFIDAGLPPVYITLGSMLSFDPSPTAITNLLVHAAMLAGCRAIVQSRWDEMPDFHDHPDIYKMRTAPHQHVFPFCSAVVHHGGAGTTHASTLHGCPSIVIEHFVDQAFFGHELKRLGVAPDVLNRRNVSAKKLAAAIRAVLDSPDMKKRAEELGAFMQKENGVNKAVELIEERFAASGMQSSRQ